MIDLTLNDVTYSHLEANIEVDGKGLIYLKKESVDKMCSKCKNAEKCNTRVKQYNNAIFSKMWKEEKIKKALDDQIKAIDRVVKITKMKKESLEKLSSLKKIPMEEYKKFEFTDFFNGIEKEMEDRSAFTKFQQEKVRRKITNKMVRFIVKHNLNTAQAQMVVEAVHRYSTVKPNEVNVRYFTNEEGVEERIIDMLRREEIPTISITKRELRELEAERREVKARRDRPHFETEGSKHRRELLSKIELGEIGVIEI